MKKQNILLIIGIALLILSAYWRITLKDFQRGKFFYRPEAQLIYSYGAGFLGFIILISILFEENLKFK